jgi:hypothetical protein
MVLRQGLSSIAAVTRRNRGSQAHNAGAGRQRHGKWAGGRGAQPGDFSRAIARTGAGAGGAFPAVFRFSEGTPDCPANLQRIPEGSDLSRGGGGACGRARARASAASICFASSRGCETRIVATPLGPLQADALMLP